MRKNNRKGFTIVELVIVIAVIAILAGVLIPTFAGVVGDAKDTAAKESAKSAYTQYLAANAGNGADLADDFIYVDGSKYVVIKDGNVDSTVYDSDDEALAVFAGEGNTADMAEEATVDNLYAVTVTVTEAEGTPEGEGDGE